MRIKAFSDPKSNNCTLKDLVIDEFSHLIDIGEFTYGPPPVIRYWGGEYKLKIGKYCSLADNINFFLGGGHSTNIITTFPLRLIYGAFSRGKTLKSKKIKNNIIIGNDVWIGSGATIMSGVSISDGAVVGARSVVASDIPAYSIFAGNPARCIRYRFNKDLIDRLLQLRWWDWDYNKISEHLTELTSEPTQELLDRLLMVPQKSMV